MKEADTCSTHDNLPLPQRGLWSASFLGLWLTQMLTATNDNIFRWLVIGIGKDFVPPARVGLVLAGGTACFVLPYLLLAAPAGYLADRFSKRTVVIACKLAEVVILALGVAAIYLGRIELLFAAVALIGAQSALFAPSKFGLIPEILSPSQISAANGLFGLATVSATVVGMGIGNWLSDRTGYRGQDSLWLSAVVLIGLAVAGTVLSLFVGRVPAANPQRRFPWNAFAGTYRDLRTLAASRPLLRVAVGIVFFWSIGALAQLNIDQFAAEGGAVREAAKNPLLFALVIGLGAGSVLAGIWSAGRVELGILPLGALGVAVSSMLLFAVRGTIVAEESAWTLGFVAACGLLFALGCSAGLYSVPLEAYLQHRSPAASRGSILAASNFLTFSGVLLSSAIYYLLRLPIHRPPGAGAATELADPSALVPLLSARQIFLLAGIITLPVLVYIVWLIPQASLRFLVWLLSRTIYRVRITGLENLPATGGALLVPNHVSWLDGVLLVLVSSRPIRMIVWAGNFQNRFLRWLAMDSGMILLGTRPKEIAAALRTARAALAQGELVCIFPEGGITRSGQLLSFRPGLLKILEGTSAPVLPVYLDGLWGSIFSFERGRFFWKWPRRWPYPLQIDFGQPFANPGDVHRVRRAVQELGAAAVTRRLQSGNPLLPALLQTCARQRWTAKIADSTGAKLTGGQVLLHTLVLRRLLRRGVWSADETHVGVLLPPSTASVTANLALAVDRRVSVNLNYTATAAILDKCLAQANVRHVLTSRRFLDKLPLQLSTEFVFIEDLVSRITALDRLVSACQAYAVPWRMLLWLLGLTKVRGHDVLTVIFTSGSTGEPKGVALTHANVASNVDAAQQIVRIKSDDVLIGVLPFFHSFGYTITLWTVGTIRAQGVYHFNPLDARTVAKLCREYRGTVLIATPTFLRMYLRRCAPEDLQTLDIVMTGAERLPRDLADAFAEKFGLRPVEGYGATELAPLAAANSPPKRVPPSFQIHEKDGTVGRPIPGVAAKVVDVTSGEELSANQEGMLWITGANVMKGYLGRDDLTAQAIRDGWYVTGDMARIDDDGFVEITGRVSRFSKIGGEMVPHIRVEEALNQLVGPNEDGSARIAVTAVSDSKKGERLIVVHTPLPRSPEDLCQALAQEGLPNLYIPSPDSFSPVDRLPVLGTGKLDLQALSELARQRFAGG